jgi:hypothetical protein
LVDAYVASQRARRGPRSGPTGKSKGRWYQITVVVRIRSPDIRAMINRLPRWVWTGAWALAFIAGMINVVGLLGFDHQAISQLTGTPSLLGVALGRLDTAVILDFLAVLGSFVAGTTISGYTTAPATCSKTPSPVSNPPAVSPHATIKPSLASPRSALSPAPSSDLCEF